MDIVRTIHNRLYRDRKRPTFELFALRVYARLSDGILDRGLGVEEAADPVLFSSRDVLTSGSAILAMTFDKPVVGPNIGCLPELLGGQTELLSEAGTDWIEDAMRWTADSDLRSFGERNH